MLIRQIFLGERCGAWLAIFALLLTALPVAAQDRLVRRFVVGSGPTAVGHVPAGEGQEHDGPQAIYAGRQGELHILDQVNERLLTFDARQAAGPVRNLKLPPGLAPTDMVMIDGGLIVWAGKPVALEVKGAGDKRSLVVARNPAAAASPIVRSMFGQTPASPTVPGLPNTARSRPTSPPPPGLRKSVATHGAGVVGALFVPDAARSTMDISVTSGTGAMLARLRLVTRDRLGSVDLIEIDRQGKLYVQAEVVPPSGGAGSQVFIARFSRNWTYEGIYAVPVTHDVTLARRFLTVSPDGEVYFLRSQKDSTDILQLAFTLPGQTLRYPSRSQPAMPDRQPPSAPPSDGSEHSTLPEPPTVSVIVPPPPPPPVAETLAPARLRALQTALAFESYRWPVTSASYGGDPDFVCAGNTRYRRPGYLWGQLGRYVYGVPYCWGCTGSLAQFAQKLRRGVAAGNVCTQNPPNADLAGVDCSSLVTAAWGLSGHFTTLTLPTVSTVVDDPWKLLPGDILNKPRSHVMMVLGFTADSKVLVMEAAVSACNGRVCRNVYALGSLLARGYVPLRYRGFDVEPSTEPVATSQAPAVPKAEQAVTKVAAPGKPASPLPGRSALGRPPDLPTTK